MVICCRQRFRRRVGNLIDTGTDMAQVVEHQILGVGGHG
jgi:hypothetical protein